MNNPPRPLPDKLTIAQSFSRAAKTYDQFTILQQEIGLRLLERLDLIKLSPLLILDLGSGTGSLAQALAARYPKATLLNLDIAEGMVTFAKQTYSNLQNLSSQFHLCADGESIPLKSQSIDFVFSNCTLQWFPNPQFVFEEIQRILKPEGLLLFSTFGPDTLKEVRESLAAGEEGEKINYTTPFMDMHNLGDLLLQTRFQDPVIDMEILTVTYKTTEQLIQDLTCSGDYLMVAKTTKDLNRKDPLQKLSLSYEHFRNAEGMLPATFEVLYGHAFGSGLHGLHSADEEGIIRIPLEHLQRL